MYWSLEWVGLCCVGKSTSRHLDLGLRCGMCSAYQRWKLTLYNGPIHVLTHASLSIYTTAAGSKGRALFDDANVTLNTPGFAARASIMITAAATI